MNMMNSKLLAALIIFFILSVLSKVLLNFTDR